MEKRINIKTKIREIEMSEKPLSACDGESFCFKLSFCQIGLVSGLNFPVNSCHSITNDERVKRERESACVYVCERERECVCECA